MKKLATSVFYAFFRKSSLTIIQDYNLNRRREDLRMKKKKRTNKTAATMAAVMGVTAAFQSVSPIVYAQEQNPEITTDQTNIYDVTTNQETLDVENTTESVTTNENTDSQVVKEETPETTLQETIIPEAIAETNVQKGVPIDEQHFPDEIFRRVVKKVYDINNNGYISDQENANIRSLDVNQYLSLDDDRIQSVKGIEYLTALENLYLTHHDIENIDLSKNTNLQLLLLNENPIASIDLSQNKALKIVNLEKTKIADIDLSALTQLELFNFSETNITSIDLSHNTNLKNLIGSNVKLTSLDVSMLTELTYLDIHKSNRADTPLDGLDLSNNTKLETAYIQNNLCSHVNVENCLNLKDFNCLGNQLTSLDVHNSKELINLYCGYNELTNLDLTNLTKLQLLSCARNQFSYLDLTNQKDLKLLDCNENHLIDLKLADEAKDVVYMSHNYQYIDLKDAHVKDGYDFSKLNPNFDPDKIISIEDGNNHLIEDAQFEGSILKGLKLNKAYYIKYEISKKSAMTFVVFPEIYCDELTFPDVALREFIKTKYDTNKDGRLEYSELSRATTIDLSGNKNIKDLTGLENFTYLVNLHCDNTNITTMDVSKIKSLQIVTANNVPNLKSVNVTGCDKLSTLRLKNTGITSLDVTKNPKLDTLDCSKTKLTSIDVSHNPTLFNLCVTGTDISTLDVTKNLKLIDLQLANTKIRSIDVSQNKNLQSLTIHDCFMDTLDITQNLYLVNLFANNNNFTELNVENNKKLKYLEVSGNKLIKLDVQQNPELIKLDCESNDLSTLDLTHNAKLKLLNCGKNHLYDIQFAQDASVRNFMGKNQKANTIVLEDTDTYDLKELYGKDVEISNLKGATLDGMILKDIKRGTDITYTISYKNGIKLDVTLRFVLNNAWKTPLTISDWTYGDTPKEPQGEALYGDVTFTYSDSETGTFTTDVPTNAGTWYVKASVEDDRYVELSAVASFTIHKATPIINSPQLFTSYQQTSNDVALPEGFTWTQEPVTFDHIGDYTLKALYTPADTKNYNSVDVDVIVHVEKAKNAWITPLEIKGWYKGQTPNAPYAKAAYGDVHYVYSKEKYGIYTNTQPTQKGTWYVKAIVMDNDNYNGLVSEPIAFEIKVKEITTIIHGNVEVPEKEEVKQEATQQMVKKDNTVTTVQTGDHTKAGLFTMMGMVSLAALAVLDKRKKAIKK